MGQIISTPFVESLPHIIDLEPKPRILIVDDNTFNLYSLGLILKNMGIFNDTATDGNDAIALMLQGQEKYSLIFMDCEMPICNGFQVFIYI